MTEDQKTPLSAEVLHKIPQTEVCTETLRIVQGAEPVPIFNHSIRVYLIARFLAEKEDSEWARPEKLELLFVAAAYHDFGVSSHDHGPERFEVCGADMAKQQLELQGRFSSEDSHRVWVAIAVHTSPGIAERIDPLARLIRLSVKADFSRDFAEKTGVLAYCDRIEQLLPRLDVERTLASAVISQAKDLPSKVDSLTWPSTEKHPAGSWPGILLRAHIENPDWDGINPAF